MENRAANILNPNMAPCGGILDLKEIAAIAEPHYVAVCPHNHNSTTIALAAAIQAATVISRAGYIRLPTAPSLRLEINEEALIENPFRESTATSETTRRNGHRNFGGQRHLFLKKKRNKKGLKPLLFTKVPRPKHALIERITVIIYPASSSPFFAW